MILNRKHIGCLDLPLKEVGWVSKTAKTITHVLAHDPESVRSGEFYVMPFPDDAYQPVDDAGLLLLATMVVAAGWPAVALKRAATDCNGTQLVLVMIYLFPPAWVPDEYTYTPHVAGSPPENLKLETKTWTLWKGRELQTVSNPYYREP